MKLKGCNCTQCRHARNAKHIHDYITKRKRNGRRTVRRMLHLGIYDALPIAIPLGYLG